MTRYCPFCKAREGFEAALIPLPCDYPAIWRCVACGEEFDKVPEPSLDEWAEMVEMAEEALQLRRTQNLHKYGDELLSARDRAWDGNDMEFRKR